MIVGSNNYVHARGRCMSRVFLIKHRAKINTGEIVVGSIFFPTYCIDKRVRVKIEFVDVSKVFSRDGRLVEKLVFERREK